MEAGRRTKDEKQGTKLGRQLAMGPKCEFFEFQSGFFWEQRKKLVYKYKFKYFQILVKT